jgi:hypothetical protein
MQHLCCKQNTRHNLRVLILGPKNLNICNSNTETRKHHVLASDRTSTYLGPVIF